MRIGRTRSVSGITTFSTVCMKRTLPTLTMLAGLVLLGTGAAQAGSVKFFGGSTGYTAPNGMSQAVYEAIKNDPIACPSGNCNSGNDVITASPGSQSFQSGFITATAPTGGGVWFDQTPAFGGLGVGLLSQGSDADQIEVGDTLHLHFNSQVALTGIATLFVDGHKPFGTGFGEETNVFGTNSFKINGTTVLFGTANAGAFLLTDFVGQDFDFTAIAGQPTFYISGLTWVDSQCTNCENPPGTPIPGAVWLFGTVIAGGAGYGRWRKKRKAATNAA